MPKRFRHPEFGEYQPLELARSSVTVMVSDAEIRGLVQYLNNAQRRDADRNRSRTLGADVGTRQNGQTPIG
jgi:hypothetical protein